MEKKKFDLKNLSDKDLDNMSKEERDELVDQLFKEMKVHLRMVKIKFFISIFLIFMMPMVVFMLFDNLKDNFSKPYLYTIESSVKEVKVEEKDTLTTDDKSSHVLIINGSNVTISDDDYKKYFGNGLSTIKLKEKKITIYEDGNDIQYEKTYTTCPWEKEKSLSEKDVDKILKNFSSTGNDKNKEFEETLLSVYDRGKDSSSVKNVTKSSLKYCPTSIASCLDMVEMLIIILIFLKF